MKLSNLALLVIGSITLIGPSAATAQIEPRIAIAFDTSGSMALDLDGLPTFGDGVLTNCTAGAGGALCGANCTAGIDTNCDGLPNDSRMSIAKQAVSDTILAFGDVAWMLSRFPQTMGTNLSCLQIDDFECNVRIGPSGPFYTITSYGNPQCNTGAIIPNGTIPTFPVGSECPVDFPSFFPAMCRPGTGGRPPMRMFGGGSPNVCTNYAGQCSIGGGASSGGDILVGFPDRGAYSGMDNTYGMLRWLDNAESNFVNSRTVANFCNHASGVGDCELRPEGGTPLAGLLTAVGSYMTPIRAADSAAACRPYSVILLTDGQESCGGTPTTAAANLRAAGILTYVVGFAVSGGSRAQLNAIATAGGTDAGAPGGDTAFFADDLVTLSAGLASIVQDSLRFEVCNFADDDCDTRIDEGVQNACGGCGPVPTETCNGSDDDCDGTTDEGVANACGTCGPAPVEICNRSDDDCDGIIDEDGAGGDICAGCTPSAEICDGRDNDCDGTVDEDVSRACGTDVGECTAGTETCVVGGSGTFGSCVGSTGPTAESCDGLDNDCDGTIDGFSRPCGVSTGECLPGNQVCVAGSFGSCVGAVGPTTELCDGEDDDCDGSIDEGDPGGGGDCGTALGICTAGTLECMGGTLVCRGGTGPDPSELCNGLDDNCNGVTDEGNPGGGARCGTTDVGVCEFGVDTCVSGAIVCIGATGPTAEVCDGLDNDCDGSIDEGDPEAGGACGDDTGECTAGTFACISGTLTCMGGRGPTAEICDGLDNDCDGVVDDGIPVGAPCGSDVGECVPGRNICRDGGIVCEGGIPSEAEACDDLDNDCDGTIDEGLGVGDACGTAEGVCMPGTERCISGRLVCEGEVGPMRESCDCSDNDCDGMIDEPPDMGSLCPAGSSCVDCQCALPCMTSEFGFVCPTGRAPVETDGSCFCVAERCNEATCGGETVERMGETLCAPDSTDVASCVCRSNECTFSCDGVVCTDGTVCDPRDPLGRCVENNCRGLGCGDGELCNVETGECDSDPCNAVTCAAGEACRDGACEGTCASVECGAGEVCHAGLCETDRCVDVSCGDGEICDAATGECGEDLCAAVTCASMQVCEPATGNCVADPCIALNCPDMTVCEDGECIADMSMTDAGVDAGGADAGVSEDMNDRVLAAGGCNCRVGAPTRATGSSRTPFML
ncbi:MAG TPA: VWA domain-containing protein, partial [Polyangiaceae bacterium]|nr:VWA domain-containing protein [Polyangiaceae bacterium]